MSALALATAASIATLSARNERTGAGTGAYGLVDGTRIIARLPAAMAIAEGPLPLCYAPSNRHYFDPQNGARVEG